MSCQKGLRCRHVPLENHRFPFVEHVRVIIGQEEGPINDEVGRDETGRSWRKGGDRSGITCASVSAVTAINTCSDPHTCHARSSGAAEPPMSRTKNSYKGQEVGIWPNGD